MRGKACGMLLVVALTATACAGDVVRYHDARVGPDGVTIVAGDSAAAEGGAPAVGEGEVVGSDPAGVQDTSTAETTAAGGDTTTTGAALPVAPGGSTAPLTTSVSGPVARHSQREAAAGQRPTVAAAGGGPASASGSAAAGAGSGGRAGPSAPGSPGDGGGSGGGGAGAAASPIPGSAGSTVGITKDAITIGVFYPKSGAYTGFGRNAPAVTQAAFDEAGLVNGRRLVARYYDDGTANASTIQVEEKRAKDEAFQYVSVVGESNVVLAPLADRHKVPVVVGNIDQKVALPLTYAFAVYAYWAWQATILPGFIKNTLGAGAKKIAVVYESTSTASDAKNAFKDKARAAGLNVIFEQPISQNQSTCANEVSNLQARSVELVVAINGPLGGICLLRDARALGYKPMWTGVGPSWGFNVVAQASGGGADGIRMLRTTPTLDSPEGRHYRELMHKAAPNSGAESDDVLLIFYSILRSAIEALRRAGPDLTREGLVHTWETKMSGYDSGYLPPPTFGPGNRSGPLAVGVSACCTDGQWTTPTQGWRASF